MLSPKRLLEMARKWQKIAAFGRKRISWKRRVASPDVSARGSWVADRGHFVVYSSEGERFMVPLAFLNTGVFQELLNMSEEEFGLPRDGPITVPCDAVFLEYAMSLLKKGGSKDAGREMLISSFMRHCSRSSLCNVGLCHQLAVF